MSIWLVLGIAWAGAIAAGSWLGWRWAKRIEEKEGNRP